MTVNQRGVKPKKRERQKVKRLWYVLALSLACHRSGLDVNVSRVLEADDLHIGLFNLLITAIAGLSSWTVNQRKKAT